MKSGSAPKGAPEAGAAKPQTRSHLSPADRLPVQLLLVDDADATECMATNSVDIDIRSRITLSSRPRPIFGST